MITGCDRHYDTNLLSLDRAGLQRRKIKVQLSESIPSTRHLSPDKYGAVEHIENRYWNDNRSRKNQIKYGEMGFSNKKDDKRVNAMNVKQITKRTYLYRKPNTMRQR